MKKNAVNVYRCPSSGTPLHISTDSIFQNDQCVSGSLDTNSQIYQISDGIPNFAETSTLTGDAIFARKYYATIADTYDDNVHVTFDLYNEKELDVRLGMIDLLHLNPSSKVLEVSAGTGKDSELIIKKLSTGGEIWLIDLSPDMLRKAQKRLKSDTVAIEMAIANACALPFVSNYVDALYCFAGIGHFPDIRSGLGEMARVVRPGGRVVFCEKNVPPWLRKTTYGKMLINNNPMFADPVPLNCIPVEARSVGVRWTLGNAHYVVDYTVGEGEPKGNFDVELPGHRGGTFNTRYFGKLEGVSFATKLLYEKAAAAKGISLHKWLDAAVRNAALNDLSDL